MSEEPHSFIDEIKERKVIPYFITYLGGCWAIIQLVDWYVQRNMMSPNWTHMVFYALIFIIPSVLVILFAISNKGKKFRSFHYRFLGVNIVVLVLLLGFMYRKKPLEKLAEKVMVVNEEGEEEERIVPTQKYNKRVVLFPFEVTGEADPILRNGLPLLAAIDIEQNPAQFAISAINLKSRYQKYSRDINEDVPFSVKKEIADDFYSDVFITCQVEQDGESIKGVLKCNNTDDGSEVFTADIQAKDIYEFADLVTKNYLENIYTKDFQETGVAKYTDLPTGSLISTNREALDYFIQGLINSEHQSEYVKAIEALEKALEIDPNCVECAAQLSNIYIAINNGQKSIQMSSLAMKGVEVLSERQQFKIKSNYYLRNSDMPKAIALMEMWRKLYPNNLEPYEMLIRFYPIFEGPDKAIEIGQAAVNVGHKGNFLLSIANLLANKGDYDEAIAYCEKHEKAYPERATESTTKGGIYMQAGNFDAAMDHYKQIELLKPQDVQIQKLIANVERRKGNFDQALNIYNNALSLSKNISDSVSIFRSLEVFYQKQGKANKAFEIMDQRYQMMATYLPPISIAVEIFQNQNLHDMYANTRRFDEMRAKLDASKPIFNDPEFYKLIDYIYYQVTEQPDSIRMLYEDVAAFSLAKSGENQKMSVDIIYYYIIEDFEKVLQLFDEYEAKTGAILYQQFGPLRGESYLKAGKLKEAEQEFLKIYKQYPHEAAILKNLGDLYKEMGKVSQSKDYYNQGLTILKDADPGFKLKEDIQEALETI